MSERKVCMACKMVIHWSDDGDATVHESHGLCKGDCTEAYERWSEQESGHSLPDYLRGFLAKKRGQCV